MKQKLESLLKNCKEEISSTTCLKELEDVRVKYCGKTGELTLILRGMKDLTPEERPVIGALVNEVRDSIENMISQARDKFDKAEIEQKLEKGKIDVTQPSLQEDIGTLHPITIAERMLTRFFESKGFDVVCGPEVEYDYYNFEALNIPADHPARDSQDTFFIDDELLLRSQTSTMQIRYMENKKPPIKMVSFGRVYRGDDPDATHSPVFHQFEALVVDKNVTLADLNGTLAELAKFLFGENVKTRLRPSFFPFTEPSVEVDITCVKCQGKGCASCKGTGWLEILGAGMVNPKVLENCGIDSKVYSGYAIGIGVERTAMNIFEINDLRAFFENDTRFLKQIR